MATLAYSLDFNVQRKYKSEIFEFLLPEQKDILGLVLEGRTAEVVRLLQEGTEGPRGVIRVHHYFYVVARREAERGYLRAGESRVGRVLVVVGAGLRGRLLRLCFLLGLLRLPHLKIITQENLLPLTPTLLFVTLLNMQIIILQQSYMDENNSPQCSQESRLQRKPSKIFFRYKQKLIGQVVVILVVCILAILERIFSRAIFDGEEILLADVQLSFGLQEATIVNGTKVYVPTGITSSLVEAYSYTSLFKLQFLVLTHIFITLYVSVNAILTSTLVYATMFVIYLVSVLQLVYSGPRPFWISERVFAAECMPGFNHPSRGTVIIFFVVAYTYYLFFERKSSKTSTPFEIRDYLIKLTVAMALLLIQMVDYAFGLQHMVSIALGFIYFFVVYLILRFLNSHFDSVIRKSTIMSIDAKRYTFYWLLYLTLLQLLALIIYSNLDQFAETDWIKNFLSCDQYQNITPSNLKYDQIVGAWYVFLQTATVFGWIGAIFGIAYCFRVVPSLEWFRGSTKQRVLRAVIANLFIIPSWLFVVLVEGRETDQSMARELGINDFIIDSIHFFVLYLWLFGYMPVWMFSRWLNIANDDREDYYANGSKEQSVLRLHLIES